MKKICMIVQNPMVKGGIAAVVNGYRGSLLEKDYKITYVESYKDGSKFTKLVKGICGYIHFAKVLCVNKPDVVHIHSSFGPSFYRKMPFIYMAAIAKVPIVNHIHGADFESFYLNADSKKKQKIKAVYNKCTLLIALSEEWKQNLSKIVPEDKIEVVENYSILHEEVLNERLERKSNQIVLFLGELGKRKGCYDIPDVADKVAKVFPNVKFVLAGAGTAQDEEEIKKNFLNKGLSNNVVFPGWVRGEEKSEWLKKADVFFLPSYNEGMPMSVLDAMGYGLPVVSTNVGGIPKIVRNGENGICCNVADVEEMAQGIINLLFDEQQRKCAAKASMEIVKKAYSLEKHLQCIKEIYENILNR